MIVGIQGSNNFDDYNVFLRAMGVAMSTMPEDDKILNIYSAGPLKINSMLSEFVNLSERGLKARGKKIKSYKVPPSWINENMESLNYFAFFSKPNESVSKLVSSAQLKNIETGIFRY
jgi:hypothetical protein